MTVDSNGGGDDDDDGRGMGSSVW